MKELLANLDKSILIDRLAEYTAKYTRLLSIGAKQKELNKYKHLMKDIQTEIERRRSGICNN